MNMLIYSHSDYDFVWDVCGAQMRKYFLREKIYGILNKNVDNSFFDVVNVYDEGLSYTERVLMGLEGLDDDLVVVFQHEDMFLYDEPDFGVLSVIEDLVERGVVDAVQLIRTTEGLVSFGDSGFLFELPKNARFSLQPTVIKVGMLKKIFGLAEKTNIWDFERWCFRNCGWLNSVFLYDGGPKRGLAHYDTFSYPYVATAIVKGKWNYAEYEKELTELLS